MIQTGTVMNFRHTLQKWLLRDPIRYHSVHADLVSSRSGLTLGQYLWKSIRISVLVGIIFGVWGNVVSRVLVLEVQSGKGVYNVLNLQLPRHLVFLSSSTFVLTASVAISFAFGAYITYHLLLRIPRIEKNNRKVKINLTLHNAVAYMYTMRRGGAELMTIFYAISENAPIYGEVALEFRQITRDVDYFGSDVLTAVRHLSETTPSEKLKIFSRISSRLSKVGGIYQSSLRAG